MNGQIRVCLQVPYGEQITLREIRGPVSSCVVLLYTRLKNFAEIRTGDAESVRGKNLGDSC